MGKQTVIVGILLFVLFFLVTKPANAAVLVHSWYGYILDAARSLVRFVDSL